MSVVNALNLSISFGENTIFDNITFDINEKEKIGLVGVNGAGKTTLFKILTGAYTEYQGAFTKGNDIQVGYMEQHTCSESGVTVYDELVSVFQPLIDMENEIELCSRNIEKEIGSVDENINRLTFLTDEFHRLDGLTYVSRTKSTLTGLGFSEDDFSMTTDKLSGGQRSKLVLAKLLLSDANLLLLDEPTNHLDIDSVEWLESFLQDFRGSVLLISHDRYFLDRVTNKTMEIKNGKMITYLGNYSEFLVKKEKIQQDIQEQYEIDQKEIERLLGIVAQQRQWNREKNIKTAESKLKQIERIKATMIIPDAKVEKIKFDFSPKIVSGNDVLQCENLSKNFWEKEIFKNVDFLIKRKERIFLLGANGCGKTTLLKVLMGDYVQNSGRIIFGANVQTGYFDQVQERLDMGKTAIDEVWDNFKYMTQTGIRNALAAFLFRGDDVFQKIETLSGGERARIALLKLMLGGYNFLLLDEPTNHLDAFSREELENTLLDYDGTMLIVSHDRYFINKLADRIFYLTDDGIAEFSGNYDDYIGAKTAQFVETKKEKSVTKTLNNEYKQRKEAQSSIRRMNTQLEKAEDEISNIEGEIEETKQALQSDEVSSNYELLIEKTSKLEELNVSLDEKMALWEELSSKLQEFMENN